MTIRAGTALLLIVATPLAAHDFWIQAPRFQAAPGAPLPLTFLVGHGKFRDRWNNNQRIVLLADFFGGRRTDLRGGLRGGGAADLIARFDAPGLHVVGLQSNYAYSQLPAIRFNDYAREEGLRRIITARAATSANAAAGRERYSRRAKALFQIGKPTPANQALATRPIGLKLEIVPDLNPYVLGPRRMLPLHVLYNGRRLANATVKLTNLGADDRPVAVAVTDRSGRARFRIPDRGQWQVNVVWGEPLRGDPKADFDTVFSSLTFGDAG